MNEELIRSKIRNVDDALSS